MAIDQLRRKSTASSRSTKKTSLNIGTSESTPAVDWLRVVKTFLVSRALDDLEETKLLPEKKILYQFSARGHELGQILLGMLLTQPHDAASGYYRSRPLLLTLGLSVADALKSGLGKGGGISDGRDIGVVFNMPSSDGATVLPMAGGMGACDSLSCGDVEGCELFGIDCCGAGW
jgi:2-oxoisovalerate dehydrogenase E1 component